MFNLFKLKPKGKPVKLKIEGMHCTSCAMNIDGELEELEGVTSTSTSYAKSETTVHIDTDKLTPKELIKTVRKAGYKAKLLS